MSLSLIPLRDRLVLSALFAVVGLLMGSALNCFAYRYVHKQSWSKGRSKCPSCGHVLGVGDLVPLFSWLFLRGRCRYCGDKISARYPITEFILSAVYVSMLFRFGLDILTVNVIILCSCLFTLSLIDIDIQIIPDRLIIIPAVTRIIQLFFEGGWKWCLYNMIPAVVLGGGMLALALVMDKLLKKESMGGGDIKLLAMLGLWFSLPSCLLLLIAACVIGLIFAAVMVKAKPDTPFPFGPAISVSAYLCLLFAEPLTAWYIGLF